MSFLRGDVASSPRLILTMIRHLPEGSNYVAKLASAPVELDGDLSSQPIAEPDPIQEHKLWNEDRKLMAQLINAVNLLVTHSINWEKRPKFPMVGPSSWSEGAEKPTQSKPLTVMDVIKNVTGQNG